MGQGEESYTAPPDQAQDYLGADPTAAEGSSAPEAAYTAAGNGAGDAAHTSWEEVQQWADYYRQQGYSEEDVQSWIASNYPQFAQQPASQDPSQQPRAAYEAAGMEAIQAEQPGTEATAGEPNAAEVQATPFDGRAVEASGQPHGSFQGAPAQVEGMQQELGYQDRSRLQSEAYSDMAECGSSRGHLDDLTSVGTVSACKRAASST